MIMAAFDGFISFCDFIEDSPAQARAQVFFFFYRILVEWILVHLHLVKNQTFATSFFEDHYKDKDRHQKLASKGSSSSVVPQETQGCSGINGLKRC